MNDHTIIPSAAGVGTISPVEAAVVKNGESRAFSFTPGPGKGIRSIDLDGVPTGSRANPFTLSNVTSFHRLNVTFDTAYTITASAGANGTISPSGATSVLTGGSLTFSITPTGNHTLATLIVDGQPVPPALRYTFSNVTSDHSLQATFTAASVVPDRPVTQAGEGVTLTPAEVPGASRYHWDFGNGHTATAPSATPQSFDYEQAGPYIVTLTATDGGNSVMSTATTGVTVNYGKVQVAPAQSPEVGTVAKTDETLSDITQADLRTRYGVTDETMRPLRKASTFNATLDQPRKPAVFRISLYDVPVEVAKLRLLKLRSDGTSKEYEYASSAAMDEDGKWWITDAEGYDIPVTATLAAGTLYWANFVILDDGPFDADPAPGQITDPVTIARSDTPASSGSGGGGGCSQRPSSGIGIELLALVLGGAGLTALGRGKRGR